LDNKKPKILVVEDNLINQAFYKKTLSLRGYEILTADNGREAITEFITDPEIGLIFMDVHMPVLDGLETARSIRSIEEKNGSGRRVPIVAVTAYDIKLEDCLAAGFNHCIMKPVSSHILDELLGRFLPD